MHKMCVKKRQPEAKGEKRPMPHKKMTLYQLTETLKNKQTNQQIKNPPKPKKNHVDRVAHADCSCTCPWIL